ncbi:transposase (fragment) [Xenorhabdus bovienii str. kraussei Becker Underwood]|uniref:Transposase n=1 Tax=Xenorhabdus bovienii str. kraussei Becker Underwood TaxID=1398204 RepID=A0A077PRR7_XENBV
MNKKSIAQGFISDELWQKIEPLLPPHKTHHPLGHAPNS